MNVKTIFKKILGNKLSFLWAAILGVLIGIYIPAIAQSLGQVGDVFVNLMRMCVLPIVVTSITLSIAHFIHQKMIKGFSRAVLVFVSTLMLCSIIGVGTAFVLEPGSQIDPTKSEVLKTAVRASSEIQRSLKEPLDTHLEEGALKTILDAIPSNIFSALASNSIFQIIIFALIFGIALGSLKEEDTTIERIFKQAHDIFYKIFMAITYIFPLALICLIARDTQEIGGEALVGMGGFVSKFYVALAILFLISALIIKVRTRTSFIDSLSIMRDPMLIALATKSSTASIPPSIMAMQRFHYDPNLIKLMIPLGSIVGRYGHILYFGFAAMFAIQLYSIELGLSEYVLIAVITVIAGISTTGQSSHLSLSTLSVVLTPIGIPITGVLPLMIAVDPLIDPFRTMAIAQTNCATVALMGKPEGPPLSIEEVEAKNDKSSPPK